jgi:transcriptional regulator with XRE-family HTH domain
VLHRFCDSIIEITFLSEEEVEVADDAYGAIVAKLRLARRLAGLRVRAGMSLNETSDKLGWSRGRLNRFEANQWRQPDPSHVRDLARIYGTTDGEREELEDLVTRARVRLWWYEPEKDKEKVFSNEFAGFENDAARISVYMPLVLPGLLQTPAYARAQLGIGHRSPQWRERALAARLRRQQILDRADGTAPRLISVITEASLMYRWGSQEDRRAQVAHLAAMSRRPSVELRLLRFADGPHPGMISPVNIFDFPDDEDPSVVYLENDTGIQEVTKASEVDAYRQTFARIRDAALAPAATRTHLDTLSQTQE